MKRSSRRLIGIFLFTFAFSYGASLALGDADVAVAQECSICNCFAGCGWGHILPNGFCSPSEWTNCRLAPPEDNCGTHCITY